MANDQPIISQRRVKENQCEKIMAAIISNIGISQCVYQ